MKENIIKPVILCVDDEPFILNALNEQLNRRFGNRYFMEFAESAEEAMGLIEELSEENNPLVMVISDQIMPGMAGDEFLSIVEKSHPETIKIMLTGQAAMSSAINAINNANLFRYLTKPWEENDFLLTIKRGLDQYEMNRELKEKNRELSETLNVLKCFVPDPIQQRIAKEGLRNIEPGYAQEDNATILFSDLHSYTSFSEHSSPGKILRFLNDIGQAMIPVIHENNGFINQFVGDSIMAIFYQHEQMDGDNALKSAISMQKAIDELNRKNKKKDLPNQQMGIGLNTGKITTGTIGNQVRMDAAVIGDVVNLASRVESLTRFYRQKILITTYTVWRLKNARMYKMRPIDLVRVKGKTKPVEIMEVFEADEADVIKRKEDTLETFMTGLEAFRNLKWKLAEEQFIKVLKNNPEDTVSSIYLERTRAFMEHPPPTNWDCVIDIG